MINKLVIENLKYRWVRTFLSALVVGVQVMSILTLIGLSKGMLQNGYNSLPVNSASGLLLLRWTDGNTTHTEKLIKQ